MIDEASRVVWECARTEFLEESSATKQPTTTAYHKTYLASFYHWLADHPVVLTELRKAHLNAYMAHRKQAGLSERTRRHDAVVLRGFLKWCRTQGYLEGAWLGDIQIPSAKQAHVEVPTDEQVQTLLAALQRRWKPGLNPATRYVRPAARQFFLRRNYAVILGLLKTGARISEMINLRVSDYRREKGEVVFRRTKNGTVRTIPLSPDWIAALDAWLAVRGRLKLDNDYMFVSENGDVMKLNTFYQGFQGYCEYAGLPKFTLHSLRHYALTRFAKVNLFGASAIAGHSSLAVTRRYLHEDRDFLRGVMEEADRRGSVVVSKRGAASQEKKKRKV